MNDIVTEAIYKISCALCKKRGYHVKPDKWQTEIFMEAAELFVEKLKCKA